MRWWVRPVLVTSVLFGARPASPPARLYTTVDSTNAWLSDHRPDYTQAITHARQWLAPLVVDPAALRAHDIKGKKKLVELLGFWDRLYRIAIEDDKPALLARIDALAEVTRDPRYHDLSQVDDRTFKQDATSYLRAAYLLDRLGLDVSLYEAEIARIQPRMDAHLKQRGAHQRYMFHVYYGWFGLEEPFVLGDSLEDGLIAHRKPAATMDRDDAYALTHEIFGPFDYGDDLGAQPPADADLRYLRAVLPELVETWIRRRDPDLVAELVSCLRYIRAVDLPSYTAGLAFLLDAQHADGHWGDYDAEAAKIGAWATTYKLELHTTAVAIDALTVAFHPAWNIGVTPNVPPATSAP